ncbi:39S ribosomal protein L41, mitochondrial [Hemicordylus capensis]|uniref:39S ribosomal protein L41, mitochondrial n=1 Tax=Hemicordylus capensis TaxID=884348 RepID=UPI002302DE9A|nr:39S ribosomal protein L41, mitochondrial [Hemicordylus capensis]
MGRGGKAAAAVTNQGRDSRGLPPPTIFLPIGRGARLLRLGRRLLLRADWRPANPSGRCCDVARAQGAESNTGEGRRGAMGLLGELARGLVRGADRMGAWTSKRGSRFFYKSRGAKVLGYRTSSGKFRPQPERVPRLVVPDLAGFRLRPYVSYRAPPGSEPPLSARALFQQTAAPALERDLRQGRFDPQQGLEKYGFEPQQEGRLFCLFPKNFVR